MVYRHLYKYEMLQTFLRSLPVYRNWHIGKELGKCGFIIAIGQSASRSVSTHTCVEDLSHHVHCSLVCSIFVTLQAVQMQDDSFNKVYDSYCCKQMMTVNSARISLNIPQWYIFPYAVSMAVQSLPPPPFFYSKKQYNHKRAAVILECRVLALQGIAFPSQRPAASAAASVTLTSSRARLR